MNDNLWYLSSHLPPPSSLVIIGNNLTDCLTTSRHNTSKVPNLQENYYRNGAKTTLCFHHSGPLNLPPPPPIERHYILKKVKSCPSVRQFSWKSCLRQMVLCVLPPSRPQHSNYWKWFPAVIVSCPGPGHLPEYSQVQFSILFLSHCSMYDLW